MALDLLCGEQIRITRHVRSGRRDPRIVQMQQVPIGTLLASANVGQVRTDAHQTDHGRLLEEEILRDGVALAPTALKVAPIAPGSSLLSVTSRAPIRSIDFPPLLRRAGAGERIGHPSVQSFFWLRVAQFPLGVEDDAV